MSITILNQGVAAFTSISPAVDQVEATAIRVVMYEEAGETKTIELLPPDPNNFVVTDHVTDDHLKTWVEDAKAAGQPEVTHN